MKIKKIPYKEKEKVLARMLSYVRTKVKDDDATEKDLYYACKTAGWMLCEFLTDYIDD